MRLALVLAALLGGCSMTFYGVREVPKAPPVPAPSKATAAKPGPAPSKKTASALPLLPPTS